MQQETDRRMWAAETVIPVALLHSCDKKRAEQNGNMYEKVKKDWLYGKVH